MLCSMIIVPGYLRNLATMLKQWRYFTQTKHGFTFQATSIQGIIDYGQTITPYLRRISFASDWCLVRCFKTPCYWAHFLWQISRKWGLHKNNTIYRPSGTGGAICSVSTRWSNCSQSSKFNESYFWIFWRSNNFKRQMASAKSDLSPPDFILWRLLKDHVYRVTTTGGGGPLVRELAYS